MTPSKSAASVTVSSARKPTAWAIAGAILYYCGTDSEFINRHTYTEGIFGGDWGVYWGTCKAGPTSGHKPGGHRMLGNTSGRRPLPFPADWDCCGREDEDEPEPEGGEYCCGRDEDELNQSQREERKTNPNSRSGTKSGLFAVRPG